MARVWNDLRHCSVETPSYNTGLHQVDSWGWTGKQSYGDTKTCTNISKIVGLFRWCAIILNSILKAPNKAIYKAVRVRLKLLWTNQDAEDARKVGLCKETCIQSWDWVGLYWSNPGREAMRAAEGKAEENGLPMLFGVHYLRSNKWLSGRIWRYVTLCFPHGVLVLLWFSLSLLFFCLLYRKSSPYYLIMLSLRTPLQSFKKRILYKYIKSILSFGFGAEA